MSVSYLRREVDFVMDSVRMYPDPSDVPVLLDSDSVRTLENV